ncbi:phage distal tail protein [Streptomyces sp. NPDC060198]|uniref:phage distal tail protein n=1 Tax=Streptomyces sp. NPDC060198 TaxID=3347070 RepID=UPI003663075F
MPYTPGQSLGGLTATLGEIPLGSVDPAGVAWVLQDLDGWDSPEVRSELQQREADHGAWQTPVYYGERPITLAGTIVAPDRAALDDAMDRLRAAVSLTDTLLTVAETVPKCCVVRRSGKLLARYTTDTVASYSALVTAADPRRYATADQTGTTGLPSTSGGLTLPATVPWTISATTVSGQIDAENSGSMRTPLVLTITGPVQQPQILVTMPGGAVAQLTYSQDLGAGDVLVIDTTARTVVLNGNVSRRRFLAVPSGWPSIPPASTVAVVFRAAAYNATASLTATWRSAWD